MKAQVLSTSPAASAYLAHLECDQKPPETLHYIGKIPAERQPTVAIVGTRKPSTYGKEVTHTIASTLARQGVIIVSGLAYGVDAIAHTAALDVGGTTIAVMAHGLHDVYPKRHQQLAHNIVEQGGALVSEYDYGITARQHTFLARNRIVSGLADAVIITEAAARSGTLNTAGHALNQGKELFIVPGNITSALSAGCNSLLLQGATPLLDPQQIIDILGLASQEKASPIATSSPVETAIVAAIQDGVRDGDILFEHSGASITDFNTALTMLEINGIITPLGANRWALA